MIFDSDRIWQAKFISCKRDKTLPVMIKHFNIEKPVKSASVYACGLGLLELKINGKSASENLFDCGETNFDKKAFYVEYDITELLKIGYNEIYAYLGKGFYYNSYAEGRFNRSPKIWGELMLIAEIKIDFADGTVQIIGTDESWEYSDSPVTECSWLGGEDYDANIKISPKGSCTIVNAVPFETLVRRNYPPIRITEKIKPVSINRLDNGDFIVKFERNFAGIYTFTADLKQGAKITFSMAEMVNDDGSVDQRSCVFNSKTYDTYTADNSGVQHYTPKFVYHAGKFLQISGIDNENFDIIGYAVRCDNEQTGVFETDNETVNKIHSLILNSVKDNMQNVITDCPHREKLGWLEQTHLLYDVFASNFDVEAYYGKIIMDMCDAQRESGSVPSIVPPLTVGIREHALRDGADDTPNDPAWCGAIILVPYYTYLEYGDIDILKKAYPSMKKYMDYLISLSDNYLLDSRSLNRDLGDWVSLEYTDVSFVVSCVFYQLVNTMARISKILGSDDYSDLDEKIKNAVNDKYYNRNQKRYLNGTQTANALSVYLGIAPDEDVKDIVKSLADNVISHNYHFTCGEVGIKALFYVLSDNGYADLAYKMIMNDDMPSYKYFVDLGRTTLPESWQAKGTWSQNHCMLGMADAWFYRYIGGIQNMGVAYDKVKITPYLPPDINYAKIEKGTPYGKIQIELTKDKINIIIPEGITVL